MLIQSKSTAYLTNNTARAKSDAGQSAHAQKQAAAAKLNNVSEAKAHVKFEGFAAPNLKLGKATASYQGQATMQQANTPLGQHIDKYI